MVPSGGSVCFCCRLTTGASFVHSGAVSSFGIVLRHQPGQLTVMALRRGSECDGDLFHVIGTFKPIGLPFGLGQGGKEHACENADNGNHHEQLNKGKTLFSLFFHSFFLVWVMRLFGDAVLQQPHPWPSHVAKAERKYYAKLQIDVFQGKTWLRGAWVA